MLYSRDDEHYRLQFRDIILRSYGNAEILDLYQIIHNDRDKDNGQEIKRSDS